MCSITEMAYILMCVKTPMCGGHYYSSVCSCIGKHSLQIYRSGNHEMMSSLSCGSDVLPSLTCCSTYSTAPASVKWVSPCVKRTWALKVFHTVTGNVFKATQILWHHGVSLVLLLVLVVFREESGAQIGAQGAGHEVDRRDGGLGHVRSALHVPN